MCKSARVLTAAWAAVFWLAVLRGAEPFTVVVYNVENLFDADGVAAYDDYQPNLYTPAHLSTKIGNAAAVLAKFERGRGPSIVLFQEIEFDQTRSSRPGDYDAFLEKYRDTRFDKMLAQSPLPPELAGLPSEAWLLKAMADRGLTGYHVIVGDQGEDGAPRESPPAVKCVIFSRFPVKSVQTHPLTMARDILEVCLEVRGYPLHVFNNHWKSGAGDGELEKIRVENAGVLRRRLDALLRADPNADILIGGDFNSQYNQKQRYPAMSRTGLNDVLGSQGNELAIRGPRRDLYNLWFELPPEKRGSDTYKGEWGTLMNLMLTRGLYDLRGVHYIDNTFGVAKIPGLNVDSGGVPVRWSADGAGSGFSDHLPIFAHFATVDDNRPDRWLELVRPSQTDTGGAAIQAVDYGRVDLAQEAIVAIPAEANLRDGTWSGKIFRVRGPAASGPYPTVRFQNDDYEIYGQNPETRERLQAQRKAGRYDFYGELGTFKGKWQFVVRDEQWVK